MVCWCWCWSVYWPISKIVGYSSEAEAGDRELVLSASDVFDQFDLAPLAMYFDPAGEHIDRDRYLSGGYAINYEYAPSSEDLYISTVVNHEGSTRDAGTFYTGSKIGFDVSLKLFGEGLETREIPSLITIGQHSESGWIIDGVDRVGAYAPGPD